MQIKIIKQRIREASGGDLTIARGAPGTSRDWLQIYKKKQNNIYKRKQTKTVGPTSWSCVRRNGDHVNFPSLPASLTLFNNFSTRCFFFTVRRDISTTQIAFAPLSLSWPFIFSTYPKSNSCSWPQLARGRGASIDLKKFKISLHLAPSKKKKMKNTPVL